MSRLSSSTSVTCVTLPPPLSLRGQDAALLETVDLACFEYIRRYGIVAGAMR